MLSENTHNYNLLKRLAASLRIYTKYQHISPFGPRYPHDGNAPSNTFCVGRYHNNQIFRIVIIHKKIIPRRARIFSAH